MTFLVFATILVMSAETETVYNPHTSKLDFIRASNFTTENITVECILFDSGGQICDNP